MPKSESPNSAVAELARQDARRRQHSTTEPEHLLAALLAIDAEAVAVHARGLDPNELRERAEAALAERPSIGGYRDATGAPLSPAVERALGRTRRWLRKVSLLDALLQEPSIAALVFLLRRGADARYVVERARALAITRHHETVGVAHALRAVLDLRSFVDTLERAGGDVAALSSALEARLAPAARERDAPPKRDPLLDRLLSSAKFPRTDDSPVTVRELCIGLARAEACETFWSAAGITPSAFLDAVLVPK